MMNSNERYAFVGELKLYTYKNLFPNDAPKAQEIFDQIEKPHRSKSLDGFVQGLATLSLRKIDLSEKGFAKLLFWLVNPTIPDSEYADQTTGKIAISHCFISSREKIMIFFGLCFASVIGTKVLPKEPVPPVTRIVEF